MSEGQTVRKSISKSIAVPIYVDLDGTLIKSDLLSESFLALLNINPLYIFRVLVWLLRGKASLKYEIAARVSLDYSLLPYDLRVIAFLRTEASRGRKIYLMTAATEKLANGVGEYLGVFDAIYASSEILNLSGEEKLRKILSSNTSPDFDYVANSKVDLRIWSEAHLAVVVNASSGVVTRVSELKCQTQFFPRDSGSLWERVLSALRIHQWAKNSLLFVPLILSHQWNQLPYVVDLTIAFFCFGLCASSMYILNDLLDLEADRAHGTKMGRPFASGKLSIFLGLLLSPLLLAIAFSLALSFLTAGFTICLFGYLSITVAYSFVIKKLFVMDVITLAGLYTARVASGAVVIDARMSFWLLSFSMFVFFSLALVKRFTELSRFSPVNEADKLVGRSYSRRDLEGMSQFGASSALVAVLVLSLYINDTHTLEIYGNVEYLWLLCPIAMFVLTRIWLMARRDLLSDDPVIFALTDNWCLASVVTGLGLVLLAK